MKYLFSCIFALIFIACQDVINEPPPTYAMAQNFPNPFTDTTVVLYDIPYNAGSFGPHIRVVINDRFDQTWAILVDSYNHSAGTGFRVVWNGRGANYQKAPAGIYYIELQQLDMPSYDGTYVHERKVALKQ